MNEDLVKKLAAELDKELNGHKPLTPSEREALEALRHDIQKMLHEDPSSDHTGVVLGKLRDGTTRFEVSHPNLTFAMAEVINALSTMGF